MHRHRAILVLATLLTVISTILALRLEVDNDLRRLLPRDHEVVRNLRRIEDTFGSTGSVNVVIRGGTQAARHELTVAIAERFEGHPLLRDVDYRLPSGFFADHALYFLSAQDFESLDQKIQAWLHAEFCSQARSSCITEPDPEARADLEAFVEAKREEARDRTGFDEFYERDGIEANVMLLHPTRSAASVPFARKVVEEIRTGIAEVYGRPGSTWAAANVRYNVVGPYINKVEEQKVIRRDTIRAGTFAIFGITGILYLLFRSTRAVLILLIPLCFGVTWTLAATSLVIGSLNAMTNLISTVVLGAGIDAGIHFFLKARRARITSSTPQAIRVAFGRVVIPLLVASSTTVGAFAVMATSEFPAFREFGIIAAMGVALCLLAMVTVLPALAVLVGIKRGRRPPRTSPSLAARVLLARPGLLLLVVAIVTGLTTIGARHIEFEYNGRALQSDSTRRKTDEDTHLISEIFGQDIHAGILVQPSLDAAREVVDWANARKAELGPDSVVAKIFSASELLPDPKIDPQTRREQIEDLLEEDELRRLEEISGTTSRVRRAKMAEDGADLDGDTEFDDAEPEADDAEPEADPDAPGTLSPEDAQLLLRMIDASPIGVEQLPRSVLRRVRSPDGQYGVFAYPAFDAADMRKGVEFMEETQHYLPPGRSGMFVGETTVYAAMFMLLRDEAPVVLALAALLVIVLVYWQLRSVRQAVATLLPLGLALWWLIGVMGVIGLRFTLFNLPILPAILGIGVDNGVYLTDRIRKTKGEVDGLIRTLQETGGAIMAAMSTTAIGFAAFMWADSAGVRGIGAVAVLGIVLAALAATIVLPALTGFGLVVQQRRRKDPTEPPLP